MKILVRRTGAWGDVLETTPVVRRLRQENPDAEIDFETSAHYHSVYLNSPHRIGARRTEVQYDRFIDLDGAFEKRLRKVNAVESYMEEAFGDRNGSTQLEMWYDPRPPFDMDWSNTITMHAYCALPQWPQRTLPHGFWTDLADRLTDRGWLVCCIGTRQDWPMTGRRNVVDTTRLKAKDAAGQMYDIDYSLSPQSQAAIIGASRAFVCCGSGPLMLAQVTDVPIVAMEAMSLPYMFEHERHGVMGLAHD